MTMDLRRLFGLMLLVPPLSASGAEDPPTFRWAVRAGGTNTEYITGLAVDGSSNLYVTGPLSGAARFENTLLPNRGMFIAKYDPAGRLLWAKKDGHDSVV